MCRASVLIPTHGHRAATLPLAVASVQAQGIEDIEILIVGDGVDDAVRSTVEGAKGFRQMTVMMRHGPRQAIAHAVNRIDPQRSSGGGERLPGRSRRECVDAFETSASWAERRMNLVLHKGYLPTSTADRLYGRSFCS